MIQENTFSSSNRSLSSSVLLTEMRLLYPVMMIPPALFDEDSLAQYHLFLAIHAS